MAASIDTDLSTCNLADLFDTFDTDAVSHPLVETNDDMFKLSLSDEELIYQLTQATYNEPQRPTEAPDRLPADAILPSEAANDQQSDICQNAEDAIADEFFNSAFFDPDNIDGSGLLLDIALETTQEPISEANGTANDPLEIPDSPGDTGVGETTSPSTANTPANQEAEHLGKETESRPSSFKIQDSATTIVADPSPATEVRPADADFEEPPRKRTRHRRKQIVLAGISYNQLANSASTAEPTHSFTAPQPATLQQTPVQHGAVPSLPESSTFNTDFAIQTTLALRNLGFPVIYIPSLGFIMVPKTTLPNANASIPVSNAPFPTPNAPVANNLNTNSAPSSHIQSEPYRPRPVQQFTFAETSVPESFVANPDNHGRWAIDESGRRHYLNGPKNKRPRS